ncbi:anti-sigma-I factor RsgI6-like [Babylonia areolata]|uniref:anti-sigma-I factor RsgI6-like n=1 Tax=Babylonia areolata TaxID=304850 RepID=UPI003FD4C23A
MGAVRGEVLQNGGFESMSGWDCWNIQCHLNSDRHSGQHSVLATGRSHYWEGPSQMITVTPGRSYQVSGWVKLLNGAGGQNLMLEIDYTLADNSHHYETAASSGNKGPSDGWVHLSGGFTVPDNLNIRATRFYFQGPTAGTQFLADDASVTSTSGTSSSGTSSTSHGTGNSHSVIDQIRKSNINIRVTTAANINKQDVTLQVKQTKKSFPFGTAVNSWKYNENAAGGRYRDFIHQHFNWAVPENALKWITIEPNRGQKNYDLALNMIHGLRSHGIKVRGHNLVWSVDQFVQGWLKGLYGDTLKAVVRDHIHEVMHKTQGLVEHWDVNNENLHGRWYQNQLNDPSYNLQLFRIAHGTDPAVKLFLNDYNVVANWGSTNDYLHQAQQFKSANVGLYGLGAQCHFGDEENPDTNGIKQRLDTLAGVGVPIWVTELDVMAQDENRRADFYERALRAMYGHPAVEGILFWGFWDQAHWRGEKAALVRGDNLDLTAAGRRVLDLFERQWMTQDTRDLAHAGNSYSVRGFHGDYQLHVLYKGQELGHLAQNFTLGKNDHSLTLNIHL